MQDAQRRQYCKKKNKVRNIFSGSVRYTTDLFRNKIDISRIILKIETLTYPLILSFRMETLAWGFTEKIGAAKFPVTLMRMFTD